MDEEWAWSEVGYVTWEPTIIMVLHRDGNVAVKAAVVETDDGKEDALLIFRSRLEAQAYREDTNQYTGFGIVGVDETRIAGLLGRYGIGSVALVESWDKDSSTVSQNFSGNGFLRLLEAGLKE